MRKLLLFACLVITLGISSFAVNAANFIVTRNDDRNAVCASGTDCSLREAVNAANASLDEDTINFAESLALITLTDEIVINNAGTLSINGTGANLLTIDGGTSDNRIFYISSATAKISGLTLTSGGGRSKIINVQNSGGAIFAANGNLHLDRVHLTGNSALSGGAVVFFAGRHKMTNSTVSANYAGSCAGVTNEGSILTVLNSTISGNTTGVGGEGGGLCASRETNLRNVTLTGNKADSDGGGISLRFNHISQSSNSILTLANTIIAGNTTTGSNSSEIKLYINVTVVTSFGGNLINPPPSLGSPFNPRRSI